MNDKNKLDVFILIKFLISFLFILLPLAIVWFFLPSSMMENFPFEMMIVVLLLLWIYSSFAIITLEKSFNYLEKEKLQKIIIGFVPAITIMLFTIIFTLFFSIIIYILAKGFLLVLKGPDFTINELLMTMQFFASMLLSMTIATLVTSQLIIYYDLRKRGLINSNTSKLKENE